MNVTWEPPNKEIKKVGNFRLRIVWMLRTKKGYLLLENTVISFF